MQTDHDPDRYIADLTDAEIHAAIRYLESHPRTANEQYSRSADQQNDDREALICVGLYIVPLGCLGLWLYWR